jgi:hypothetical protein
LLFAFGIGEVGIGEMGKIIGRNERNLSHLNCSQLLFDPMRVFVPGWNESSMVIPYEYCRLSLKSHAIGQQKVATGAHHKSMWLFCCN